MRGSELENADLTHDFKTVNKPGTYNKIHKEFSHSKSPSEDAILKF